MYGNLRKSCFALRYFYPFEQYLIFKTEKMAYMNKVLVSDIKVSFNFAKCEMKSSSPLLDQYILIKIDESCF